MFQTTILKNKLGHISALADFDKYGEMDVLRIFDNNSLGSYYKFLVKYEKEYTIRLSEDEEKVVEFVSKKLASGKRVHELELLKRLLKYQHGLMEMLKKSLHENYNCSMDENCAENVVNMMTNEFTTSTAKKTYSQCVFLEMVKEFVMPNTDKTAVEIEWALDTPVREDIYEYIVNG